MPETPKNQVLGSQTSKTPPPVQQPEGPPRSSDYPKAVYHKDSKPGAIISKLVQSAEEEKELGDEWGPLQIETAPAAKPEGEKPKDE